MSEVIFRKATTDDIDAATRILRVAAERMLAEGKQQWTETYPGRNEVMADLEAGVAYVLENENIVVAYAAIILTGEPAYSQLRDEWLSDMPYIVMHRLAVDSKCQQCGMASIMFKCAEALAAGNGIRSFRVDTNFDNDRMLRLLHKLGFTYCGEIEYQSGRRKAFEKLLPPTPEQEKWRPKD